MKKLDEDERERMYSKRHHLLINMPELAEMLNCKHEHIVSAQVGREVPDEVYRAVVSWL